MTSPSIAKMSAMAFKDMSRLERERMMVPHAGQCQRTPTFPSDIHMRGATFQGNIRGATFPGDSYITGATSFKPSDSHTPEGTFTSYPQTRGYAPFPGHPHNHGTTFHSHPQTHSPTFQARPQTRDTATFTSQQQTRGATLSSHPQTLGTTQITCSDCDFQTDSELDFLRHVSTHRVNLGNPEGRAPNFLPQSKRMRMSLEGTERRVQHRVVQQNHNAQVPAAEQTDSTALDLTTKPKRNTDEAPVDLRRKSTSPDTTGPAPRAERATISPRNSQSSDRQVPAAAAPPSQFPVIPQRHVQAAVMPRVPPPLIQVRSKPSQASDGKLQVESRQSTNVHPTAQQRMSHTQTFPVYQGEEMQSFVARHPNPPTLIASPNVQHLLPPPVGAKASPAYQGEEMKSFVARHPNPPTLIASPNVQHLLPPPVGAKASPAYQGEEMQSFVARHPNPPTIIASPNVQHLLPPPVGAKASPCPTQTTTSNPRQRYILPKQGKPSEEKSTVSCLNNAPKDTSDVTPARYYRLGRVPEYMRGGAWHPNQPTTVECTVPDQSITVDHTVSNQPTTVEYTITNQPTTMQCTTQKQSITVEPTVPNQPITMENTEPNQPTTMEQTVASQPMTVDLTGPEEGLEKEQPRRLSMVEWARTFAIYATAKQQEKKMKPTPRKRGPKPRTNRQNKPQKRHDHMREIELEQRQNQGEQVAQQQQQQEEEELHKRQAEQNKKSQENDTEEQSQARSNSHQEQDQEQKNSEATLCQDAGSKLWWERLQELMATMGERQKQDPGFAQKWFENLFPMQNTKIFTKESTTTVEKETSDEPTPMQEEEEAPTDDSAHARRTTIDSDYISMDESEGVAQEVSTPDHQSENKEKFTSSAEAVSKDDNDAMSKDDNDAKNEISQAISRAEKELEDQEVKDHEGAPSPTPDQVKSTDTTPESAPGDTTVLPEHSNTMEKPEKSPKKAPSPQPLNVHFFRCTPCNFFTTSKQKKLSHIRKHREKFECPVCTKVYQDKKCMEDHMQEHTGQHQQKCPDDSCRTVSSHKTTARKNYHQCPQCDYKTSVIGNMNRHVRKHTDERPYKCPHCPYAARVSHHLQEHMKRHAGERPFKCDLCSFATLKKTDLDRHQRCHSGEKPFACDLCPYRAPQKRMLVRHVLKIHEKQRPYQCQHCDFGAFEKKDMVEHMRQHSGEKPWKCLQCGYTTTRKRNLLRHVRVHTGEKPFQCSQCPYASADRRNLLDHARTHTDERPFRCTICGYGSRTKGQLGRHLKTRHQAKQYKCPHCPFTATDEARVQKHMQRHPHQLSAVYSNLVNLLGAQGGSTQTETLNNRGGSDGVPSPAGSSNESVPSPSGSHGSSEAADSFPSGASDDGQCAGVTGETVKCTV